jgi:hypothetical protein
MPLKLLQFQGHIRLLSLSLSVLISAGTGPALRMKKIRKKE